jgi:hypothetical protein
MFLDFMRGTVNERFALLKGVSTGFFYGGSMVPTSVSELANVADIRVLADCQHFCGRAIGRHGSSTELLEPPWRPLWREMRALLEVAWLVTKVT